MIIQKENKVGEVVANDFHTALVFEKYGIDFCCGGKKTIEDACNDTKINPEELINELSKPLSANRNEQRYDNWELDFLIDYIVNNHHNYVISNLPVIFEHSQKVSNKHGESHPEVVKIAEIYKAIKEELEAHLIKEEKILFPYIKKLLEIKRNHLEMEFPPYGTIQNPIKVMENEHENSGLLFSEIVSLSGNYTVPEDACNTYKVLYGELKDFENDLHKHIHLENNILFPKSIELEKSLININSKN
jgi:regulator of cell morphogenesis and NO signaling